MAAAQRGERLSHELLPHCVVCGCKLPHLPRAEAIEKGAAFTIQVDKGPARTYYRCIGRHTTEECMQAIGMIPKFVRAGSCK
jgi:hypothetical protein